MRRFLINRGVIPYCVFLVLLAAGWAQISPVFAYDANVDFVANSPNPNGVWRYGYTSSLGSAFNLFNEYVSGAQGYAWRTNLAQGAPNFSHFTLPGAGV